MTRWCCRRTPRCPLGSCRGVYSSTPFEKLPPPSNYATWKASPFLPTYRTAYRAARIAPRCVASNKTHVWLKFGIFLRKGKIYLLSGKFGKMGEIRLSLIIIDRCNLWISRGITKYIPNRGKIVSLSHFSIPFQGFTEERKGPRDCVGKWSVWGLGSFSKQENGVPYPSLPLWKGMEWEDPGMGKFFKWDI